MKSKLRAAINDIVRSWRDEGDIAPAIELWYDAVVAMRCKSGRYDSKYIRPVD